MTRTNRQPAAIPTEAELVRELAAILLRSMPPEPPLAVARRRALLDSPAYHYPKRMRDERLAG